MKGGFAEFMSRARVHSLVPVWRDCLLDLDTPVSAYARLRAAGTPGASRFAFLLESAPAGSDTWARYTFLGADPTAAWRLVDGTVEDWDTARGWHGARRPADPIEDLREQLSARMPIDAPEAGPFWGGAVGYFAYDVVRHIEDLPSPPPRGVAAPDSVFVFTRTMVIIDNLKAQARVTCAVPLDADLSEPALRAAWDAAQRDIDAVITRLRTGPSLKPIDLDATAAPAEGRSTYSREAFMAGVERIKEYIVAGDCFQALLARRIVVPHDFDGTALYRAIRALNPSPYMYHLLLDGVEIVGSSPELQVRVTDGKAIVRPIAGTCPRGATPEEDARLADALLRDEKERAEHVMLVDLGRNDIGRIAEYGSVKVTQLMVVERFSHVQHIVSEVEGTIAADRSCLGVFRATFPAGTMTGAPKVRAMEIIDSLEPERRGPYSGAIGYVAYGDRRMDLAITIRTCVIAGGEANVNAGAGIVADSVPEKEWAETEVKARAMLTAIGRVRAANTPYSVQ
ncbi:MAG: anthranilate synthase component I family protein [Gemmatimonadetes bacterium]|nr:anthranilate synthase component I family protein [Gemmatimonadota bacterium]